MTTRGISSFDKSLRCTENGFQGQDWERGTSKCSWGPLAAPPPAPPDPRGAVSSGGRGGGLLPSGSEGSGGFTCILYVASEHSLRRMWLHSRTRSSRAPEAERGVGVGLHLP